MIVIVGVVVVGAAYAVFFWRNASDVRQRMEDEQATRTPEAIQYDDLGRDPSEMHQTEQWDSVPEWTPEPAMADSPDAESESFEADLPEPSLDPENLPTTATNNVQAPEPDKSEEDKQRNYAALEQTALRIAHEVQRELRRGEILNRGRSVGAELLQRVGFGLNARGEHVSPNGSFIVDVKGPDLIVVTASSEAFGNQLEVSIFGPREVDQRLRRVR